MSDAETTPAGLLSPLEVVDKLLGHAQKALDGLEASGPVNDPELKATREDIKAMSILGRYYAYKIMGANLVALYRAGGHNALKDEAVFNLGKALSYWKEYADLAGRQYHNPLWTNRVGHVDWEQLTEWVAEDVEIARRARPNLPPAESR